MGYDVKIDGDPCIYFTYNHCKLLTEHGIYPRRFNGKTVEEIIPELWAGIKALEQKSDREILARWKDKAFMQPLNEFMWKRIPTAACVSALHALETLQTCHAQAIWESD